MSKEYINFPKKKFKNNVKVGDFVSEKDLVDNDDKQLRKEVLKVVYKYTISKVKGKKQRDLLFFNLYRAFAMYFKIKEETKDGE